jgi:hypothetical protein
VPFLIDTIMPTNEVHLMAGPSGAGKSRWLFDTLMDWQQGKPILGLATHPCKWVYVASDRSLASVNRTLTSMSIPIANVPTIPAWDRQMSLNQILDAIKTHGAELAIIESFGSFVEPPANGNCVKSFLASVAAHARGSNLTIWGVVESPKMKPYERYENPRQRVSGAASWGHFSETIFLIEPADAKNQNGDRKLFVCPRNAPTIEKDGAFDANGHLIFP